MFRAAVNHYKKLSLPLSSHTRDCRLARYPDRVEIKIPLYNEMVNDKPIVVVDKDTITIIFNRVDGLNQCLLTSGSNR